MTVSVGAPAGAAAAESRTGIKVNERGYGAIHFERIGPQSAVELGQALRDVRTLGASSVQLSAPVDDPGLPLLSDAARDLGFFFCGLAPAFAEWRGTCSCSRWLSEPLDTGKLQLFTEQTERIGRLHRSRPRRNGTRERLTGGQWSLGEAGLRIRPRRTTIRLASQREPRRKDIAPRWHVLCSPLA